MNKLDEFVNELKYIQNDNIRKFTEKAIESLPEYFFEVAASSTGKYHPSYALGKGGLVRHTKAAVRIAIDLFRLEMFKYTEDEKDLIIASLILHDGMKHGNEGSQYTITEHPLVMKFALESNEDLQQSRYITDDYFQLICGNVASHMGQWSKDYKTGVDVLPKPKTKMQNFVHICDYLASRKSLEMNFDVVVNRE
jgi:hypothetical protein